METGTNVGRGKKKRVVALIIVIAAAAFALFYFAKFKFYQSHFYSGTVINGVDCSNLSLKDAKNALRTDLENYTFSFTDPNGVEYIATADDLDLEFDDNGEMKKLLKAQNPKLWIIKSSGVENRVNDKQSVEKEDVIDWLNTLPCATDYIPTTDATVVQMENGYWTIAPEVYGNQLDMDVTAEEIIKAMGEGEDSLNTLEVDCYLKPAVLSDDKKLAKTLEDKNKDAEKEKKIEAIVSKPINFDIGVINFKRTSLDGPQLRDMIVNDSNGEPVISEEKMAEWLKNWAAENGLDNKYVFQGNGGHIVCVDEGAYYGWVIDYEATAKKYADNLNARRASYVRNTAEAEAEAAPSEAVETEKSEKSEVASFDMKGKRITDTSEETNEDEEDFRLVLKDPNSGKLLSETTYVEICMPFQQMKCYEKGVLKVDTPVVTGCVETGHDTPSNGVWLIARKQRNHHMRGPQFEDGSYEYEVDVDYWLPFNGLIGIHDLADRVEYGSNIYLKAGSHGCVNTPYDAVALIYDIVEPGTPVVVYG